MEILGIILVRGVNQPHVVIPEGVEIIGPDAFRECTRLTSVVFPSTLTIIRDFAFSRCSGLTSVNLSATSLTSIGERAFFRCTGLTSVTFPEGLTHIRAAAFSYCRGLTSVDLSQTSLLSIRKHAFYQCYDLTSIIFPSTLTGIGATAFCRCIKLTSVVFPSTRTSIGYGAFSQCIKLVSVVFPSTLTSIGYRAFYNCERLSVLVPPCQVHPNAFWNASLVVNASGNAINGSIVVDPRIIGLSQRLLALWSQNVRRQGLLRQVHRGYRVALDEVSEGYDTVQSNRERTEVLQIWREIKQVLGRIVWRQQNKVVGFLFLRIIEGGRRLVTLKSYLNQPKETKVFTQVLYDLGIREPFTESGEEKEIHAAKRMKRLHLRF